jgi:N-methylhydantoinase A/oxoprolinase/acetone carboxylase beta subunit
MLAYLERFACQLEQAERSPLTIKNYRASGVVTSHRGRRVYLGTWWDVPVYTIDTLRPGNKVNGPVIFESATTTVLVRTGDRVYATPHRWLDIALG